MMEQLLSLFKTFVDYFLHLDRHLLEAIQNFGSGTYVLLIAILFCETGLVVTPILPGDSLLFAAGTFAARGALSYWTLFISLSVAAILGDAVNYSMGRRLGPRVLRERTDSKLGKFLRPEYLEKTRAFYDRYGAKTIVIARFVPIVRTFAPFLAGVGRMPYSKFAFYNAFGGVLWIAVCLSAGYFFGNLEIVRENFTIAVLGIVFVSVLPAFVEWLRARRQPA